MSEEQIGRFALLIVAATLFLLLPLAGCMPLHGLGHGGHSGYGGHGSYGGDGGGHGGHH